MKVCVHCQEEKPEISFVKTGSGNRGNACHSCKKKRLKSKDPEKWKGSRRDQKQRWYKNKSADERRNMYLKSTYGISLDHYNLLLKNQSGMCAICSYKGSLVVDHSHATGKVRGLLCSSCNLALGHFSDDPERIKKALSYLGEEGHLPY